MNETLANARALNVINWTWINSSDYMVAAEGVDGEDDNCCCGMMGYFHFGFDDDVFLFDSWTAESAFDIFAVIVLSMLFAITLEAIRHYSNSYQKMRIVYDDQELKRINAGHDCSGHHYSDNEELIKSRRLTATTSTRLTLTMLYMIQLIVGYLVMLIVMTYNAYIFIACTLGVGIGFFISPIINPRG